MQALWKQLSRALLYSSASIRSVNGCHNSLFSLRTITTCSRKSLCQTPVYELFASPWSATQLRCARFSGADVRPGNVIERRGKIYQVVKAQHTSQGRGGAIIQVELRDIDSGNKLNERLRTDETVEKVFVKEKSLTYLYTDDETGNVVLMDSDTYSQLDVPKHLFGESVVYLQDDMKVTVQLYDERPMSASVPQRVKCTVTEAAEPIKGIGATPHYKKVLLDNGLTIQVPAHILSGDDILVNTTDNSYISKRYYNENDKHGGSQFFYGDISISGLERNFPKCPTGSARKHR